MENKLYSIIIGAIISAGMKDEKERKLLIINTGSTSTKISIFANYDEILKPILFIQWMKSINMKMFHPNWI